ncbi:hypothetical protein BVU76_13225 [Mycolicibacterium porcinum]|nr:hypothetical protein BVU76_13225 [Mycolicibacterium porcinum]
MRFDFCSPLTLLQQWHHRADGAPLCEVLLTGYTLDLLFVEQRAVALARGMGARVTILSDAHHAVHDPVDVRSAGRAYQHANVVCHGAFHPKLAVLVGDNDVWAAVGSGNPTIAGWGHNDELWIVVRGERSHGPAAFADLADWLTALAEHPAVHMPSWVSGTVTQIAEMIRPQTTEDSAVRILGNLDRPILDQLPNRPVDALHASAPFFDPDAAAVAALVTRLQPQSLTVALQPEFGSYDGRTVTAAAKDVSQVEFRWLSEQGSRVSHGKLIEWRTGDALTAMVGSPNLSRAALLTSTRSGGNCELAAVSPVAASLLPEGVAVAESDLQLRCTIEYSEKRVAAVLTLLGARTSDTGVTVELVCRAAARITLEMASTAAPGQWRPYHSLEVTDEDRQGLVVAEFLAPEPAGAAVRARAMIDDETVTSSVVFLTDAAACLPRTGQATMPRLTRDYTGVFTDDELRVRFEKDLWNLLQANAAHRATKPSGVTAPRDAAVDDNDRWGAWLNDVGAALGPALTTGLFPGALTTASTSNSTWAVDSTLTLEAEQPLDEEDEVGDDLSDRRATPEIPAELRRRMRVWAQRLRRGVTANPAPTIELRMLVTQLHLDLLAGGVWGPDNDGWADELADVLIATSPTVADDLPNRVEPYAGALVAVGLALLAQDATLHGGRPRDIVFQRAWAAVGDRAADADPELVDHYLYQPAQCFSRVADWQDVAAVIALAGAARQNPHAELLAAFEAEGLNADWIDGAWVADCGSAAPRRYAARIATLVGRRIDTYAVVVRGDKGSCVLLCRDNTFALAESRSQVWRVFQRPSPLSTPTTMLAEGLPSGKSHPRGQSNAAPEIVVQLADSMGVTLAALLATLD